MGEIAALEPSFPRAAGDRKPNLVVRDVTVPAQAKVGDVVSVGFRVVNEGVIAAAAPWYDSVFLARNAAGDDRVLLASVWSSAGLAPGESMTQSVQVTIPPTGPAGAVSVYVRADDNDQVAEVTEGDNGGAAPLDVPLAFTALYPDFRVREDHPGGETYTQIQRNGSLSEALIVTLTSSDPTEILVPATVRFEVGAWYVTIPITVVRDGEHDGDREVIVLARAAGYTEAPTKIVVEDADQPPLVVVIAPATLREGETGQATVRRAVATPTEVVVTLYGPSAELEFPATVTLPAGGQEVTFPVTAVNDTLAEANKPVTLTAVATGYLNGEGTVTVDDDDVPQLRVVLTPSETTEGSGPGAVRGRIVRDRGGPRELVVALRSGNPATVGVPSSVVLPPGEIGVGFEVTISDNAVADGTRQVAIGGAIQDAFTGVTVAETAPSVLTVYDDEGASLRVTFGAELVEAGRPVATLGTVRRSGPGATATAAALTVTLASDTVSRATVPAQIVIPQGADSATFPVSTVAVVPGAGVATVAIRATAPGHSPGVRALAVADRPGPDLVVTAVDAASTALAGQPFRVAVRLGNRGFGSGGSGAVQRLYWSTDAALDPGDVAAAELPLEQSIPAGGAVELTAQLRAPGEVGRYWIIATADGDGTVEELAEDNNTLVREPAVTVAPGYVAVAQTEVTVAPPGTQVPITVALAVPRLAATPSPVEAGMRRGEQSVVTVEVTNVGGLPTGPLTVLIPQAPWLRLASASRLPPLVPGQKTLVSLLLTPAEDLALGPYGGSISLISSNAGLSVPFDVLNLSDRIGSLAVEAVDELTYYAAGAPRVGGALVTLYDAVSRQPVATNTTPASGRVVFPELREAFYDLEVTAEGHNSHRGTVLITAARTNTVTTFLSRQTVRYQFTVVPTAIKDRTRIEITTVFEAFVPIPVLTVDPPLVDLGGFSGVVTQVNVKLENHGLIAAQGVRFELPEHPDLVFESIISSIGTLPARTAIEIPIIIRKVGAGGGSARMNSRLQGRSSALAAGRGPCFADMSFSFDLECGAQVNTYNVPLRFDQIPGDCQPGPSIVDWSHLGTPPGGGDGGVYGNGGFGGCQDCTFPPPINPPRIYSPPKNCDPCLAGIGEAAICVLPKLAGGAAGSAAKCAGEIGKCFYGLYTKGFTGKAGMGCAGNAGACLGGPVGAALGALGCLKSAGPCLPGGGGGGGGAGGGGLAALAGRSLGRAGSRVQAEGDLEIPSAAEPFVRQYRRAAALLEPFRYLLGDDAWLEVEADAAWETWFALFAQVSLGSSDGEERVSAAERGRLMDLPMPGGIARDVVERFLDRWNRTMDAWSGGVFEPGDLPVGADRDIVSAAHYAGLCKAGLDADAAAVREGYPDAFTAAVRAGEEYTVQADSSGGGICARVKLVIEQEAVITRDGFQAALEIANDTDAPLEAIGVELNFRSADGQDSTRNFGVRAPALSGLSGVDGSGIIAARSSGRATWVLIPTAEAAPTGPVTHLVGGTLRYRQGDLAITVPLAASSINVLPSAALTLKYFHERDVFADDPFTEVIEPSLPYSLGVMVINSGRGVARTGRSRIISRTSW